MISSLNDLDLHPYIRDPVKARAILDACIADNLEKGNPVFRVIHGKGKGNFRNLIHSHLEKHPDVEGFILCDPSHGGNGASWVHLNLPDSPSPEIPEPEESGGKVSIWRWVAWILLVFFVFIIFGQWYIRLGSVVLALVMEYWLWKPSYEDESNNETNN